MTPPARPNSRLWTVRATRTAAGVRDSVKDSTAGESESIGRRDYRAVAEKVVGQVAGVQAVRYATAGLVQDGALLPNGPITRKGPLIQSQLRGGGVGVATTSSDAAG